MWPKGLMGPCLSLRLSSQQRLWNCILQIQAECFTKSGSYKSSSVNSIWIKISKQMHKSFIGSRTCVYPMVTYFWAYATVLKAIKAAPQVNIQLSQNGRRHSRLGAVFTCHGAHVGSLGFSDGGLGGTGETGFLQLAHSAVFFSFKILSHSRTLSCGLD